MNKCQICQSDLSLFCRKGIFEIYKCSNCGFGSTLNTKLQKNRYHRDETYIEEGALFRNIFQKRVKIICKLTQPGKVLEVGCSTGLMLQLLKERGWEVLGIEISKKAAHEALKKGIKIIEGKFEDEKINEKFDLVILNHTLEHLENPANVLQKAKNLLLRNGLLFIDVPNFGGLSAKLEGKNWPLLLPNEHLWHFTLKSLEILPKNFGLKIIFVDRSSGIWDYANPLKGIILSLTNFKMRFFTEVITALPSWFISRLGLGSDLMVIFKKL